MEEQVRHFLHRTGPVLCLDIGSGTQNALLACPGLEPENWPRLVLPAPSCAVAKRLRELELLKRDAWLYGGNMGGAFQSAVNGLLEAGRRVWATPEAACALDNDPDKVRAMGVTLTSDCPDGAVPVALADYSTHFWETVLHALGLPLPHMVLAAAQDHGWRGQNMNNRSTRVTRFSSMLEENPDPCSWIFHKPPAEMTRLKELAQATGGPVADTATAAVLGALADTTLRTRNLRQGVTFVNVGNGHVFAALLYRGLVHGVYEHHTEQRTRNELLADLKEFRNGFLPAEAVRASGGHGTAYGPPCEEAGGYEPTFVSGPGRALLAGYGQPLALHGDMMLAGSLGLLYGYASVVARQ